MVTDSQNQYQPDFVTPPGETLQDTLESLGMSQTELAQRIGKHKKTINAIVKCKQEITPETALQLEKALGVPASFWNNRQKRYDEFLAKAEETQRLKEQESWLGEFPLREMKKHNYIDDEDDSVSSMEKVLKLLGVASPVAFDAHLHKLSIQYRKSSAFKVNQYALAAWLSKGRELALAMRYEPYDRKRFRQSLKKIRGLTDPVPDDFVSELQNICAEQGVKVVLVPELPKMPVYGATYWISDNPVIQLNIRGKKDDILWFTFFHEAGHVLLHERKKAVYLDVDKREGTEEEEANFFATEMLIPRRELEAFVNSAQLLSHDNILRFAREQGIAPGIVVGQLHHFGYAPYKNFQKLRRTLAWTND
ncbi:MAG TPA: HigA family addiction module antitoxin [Acidobacteriota bacterium]|nr:HigA family addiction module antitoxin [Acidobacteriota bacterium]